MLFSSYVFLFAFLPLTLAGYYALSAIRSPYPQRIFLVAASMVFYGWFSWKYLLLFAASLLLNYTAARCAIRARSERLRAFLFAAAVAGNLLLLGWYKYQDFFLSTLNTLAHTQIPLRGVLLPLGISFFTFQQITLQLRVRRGLLTKLPFWDYALFVSFFPQLVAGPIVRYEEMEPQFADPSRRKPCADNLSLGAYAFILGLFKKLVLADTLSVWVDNAFAASHLAMLPAWVCMLGYAFQIYFDFSGYSDMAIGLGKLFNIDLPVNFLSPYRSGSVREFWKRWHITLGRMLTDLVYVPLGGNRRGKTRKCLNLFLTFLLSGLWHGAAWTFVLWGALHGAARVLEELLDKPLARVPAVLRKIGTFLFAAGAFTLFRAPTVTQALEVYRGMFRLREIGFSQLGRIASDGIVGLPGWTGALLALCGIALCMILAFRARPVPERIERFTPTPRRAVAAAVLLIACVLCISRGTVFIYFNF